MDGARFANALAFSGASPAQASWKAGVDVLSLGGTKNGVCTSEVVVFFKPELALGFLNRRKQGGQLLSKMRYLSAPWAGALPNFIARARYANAMALKLAAIFRSAGLHLAFPVEANGVFVHLAPAQVQYLEQKDWHFYWFYGEDKSRRAGDTADVYRFMCAWNTDIAALEALKIDLAQAVALV
jgi:threonine aldolase